MRELELEEIPAKNQLVVPVEYKGLVFDEPLKLDVYVDGCLMVELKAVEKVLPIHKAQLMSYMRLLNAPIGLLINFHELKLTDGIHRLILPGANREHPSFVSSLSLPARVPRSDRGGAILSASSTELPSVQIQHGDDQKQDLNRR